MARTQYLASKPRYEILDGLRGVAALVILVYHLFEGCGVVLGHGYLGVDFFYALSGFVVGYAYDDRWNAMSVGGFFKRRIGAPFTVNGGWSLTPAELYVGLVRLLYPFFAGLLLSRLRWRPALRGAFGWCSLLVGGMLLVPAMSGMANGLYEAAAILLLMPLIVAVCVFIVSVGVAYASLRLYDAPVRRWLTEKWLKRA